MAQPQLHRMARRLVMRSVARISVVTVVLFSLYASVPLGQRPEGSVLAGMVLSLLALAVVVTWQIVAVTRAPFPWLRAVEGIALSVPLLLLVFAATYFATMQAEPGSFNEPLTRIDALYFSMTVFATVGFGDISPTSQAARLLVSIQMVADLVLLGLIAKVLVGAAQRRRGALDASAEQPTDLGAPPER
jgi:voltage-gated potassium channel